LKRSAATSMALFRRQTSIINERHTAAKQWPILNLRVAFEPNRT
jgi:hypothetical protein